MMKFSGLNDDEIKRIMSVIERDFQLREKEFQRQEEIRKAIRREHERVEYLVGSKEFNYSRCIRCFKPFQFLFNPKEMCSQCQLYVCHDCAIWNRSRKTWACKSCLQLKELECLTAEWFYDESGKKYKRCGSAKVVRELYKRAKELPEMEDDLGYGTLQKSLSTDSGSSSVVRDKTFRNELNDYSKRLNFLIDHLNEDLSEHGQAKVNLKDHLQQIISEISRARMALSGPLRRSSRQSGSSETDLQNLLIKKTEEILQTNLQEFQKNVTISDFDQKLAQVILDKYTRQETHQVILKYSRQASIPLTRSNFASLTRELRSRNESQRTMSFSTTPAVDEEDTEKEEEEEDEETTPTKMTINDVDHRFIDTDSEMIKKSTERVTDWKMNSTLIESKIVPVNDDEQERYTTWF